MENKSAYDVHEDSFVRNGVDYHLDNNFILSPQSYGSIKLYQIGRLYSTRTTVVDPHVQVAFELTIVRDGSGIITTHGTPVSVKRGDIYLSFPCEIHGIESDFEKPLKYDFFAFDTDDAALKEELEKIILEYSPADKRVFCDERVSYLVGNAISEFGGEHFCSDELLYNLFSQILIYTVRNFRENAAETRPDHITEADALCYRLMNYIDTHIYSMKRLEELGDVMGYSYGYLSSLYKRNTSNTLADYYRNKKLEIAKLLVLERRMKMSEIAELLNYASVYAFSKAFKNHFGRSPESYRKNQTANY